MTGPEHYAEAERPPALADRHTRGSTMHQGRMLTLTAAPVHAILALAAPTAVGTAGPDGHAWATSPPPDSAPASRSLPPIALRAPGKPVDRSRPQGGTLRRRPDTDVGRVF